MLLIIDIWLHHKNREGLNEICKYLKLDYKYGSMDDLERDIEKRYKLVYNPVDGIDIDRYDKRDGMRKWIFGPHFSVFPDNKLDKINKSQSNLFYIMPSQWCIDIWRDIFGVKINMISMPFPVNMDKFTEIYQMNDERRNMVLIYYKNRNPQELEYLLNFINRVGERYKIFSYASRYDENDFLRHMHISKYAFILDAHESQGFAIEEIMSCNIPMLVWNVRDISQEYSENKYPSYKATTVPYWDNRCGEVFYDKEELIDKYQLFIKRIERGLYKPRDCVIDNLAVDKCAMRFKEKFL
jgi:hypothetical protein